MNSETYVYIVKDDYDHDIYGVYDEEGFKKAYILYAGTNGYWKKDIGVIKIKINSDYEPEYVYLDEYIKAIKDS